LAISTGRVSATSLAPAAVIAAGPLTYQVTFSTAMKISNMSADDFSLRGNMLGVNYAAASSAFNPAGTVLTLTYASLPEDNYTLTLLSGTSGGSNFTDASGNALDGEFSGSFPSGNGSPGGDFVTTFSMDMTTAAFPTPLVAKQ